MIDFVKRTSLLLKTTSKRFSQVTPQISPNRRNPNLGYLVHRFLRGRGRGGRRFRAHLRDQGDLTDRYGETVVVMSGERKAPIFFRLQYLSYKTGVFSPL